MLRGVTWAAATLLVVLPLTSDPGSGDSFTPSVAAAQSRPGPSVHSSDGVRGDTVSQLQGARLDAAPTPPARTSWTVAPGLEYSSWTRTQPQGPVRVHLLTARMDQPGLVLDLAGGPTVSSRGPLSAWLRADRAVAGVNADFFDISDTGAPLGVGVDRRRGLLHAPRSGWNSTFLIDAKGAARVIQQRLVARLLPRGGRAIQVTNYNSPAIAAQGIGIYDPRWGRAPGPRVVHGKGRVHQVVIRGGTVRSSRRTLSRGARISGHLLVGRREGALALRTLRVGQRVRIEKAATVAARVAVSGSAQLLRRGIRTTHDHGQLHPRTAIGVDRHLRRLHLVVVDGRSATSRGMTLVQLARLMRSLGDEDALNLDGGGSSTMLARSPAGVLGVRNQPSDGRQRAVPNGLGFRYTPPPR